MTPEVTTPENPISLVRPFVGAIFLFTPDGRIAVCREGTLTDPANGITPDVGEIFAEQAGTGEYFRPFSVIGETNL